MNNKFLFILSAIGVVVGLSSAYLSGAEKKLPPPVFNPAPNPYVKGIYANGIIESYQTNGENINLYPEVPGIITGILVAEGETVREGTPLLTINDSIQKATTEQLKSQAEAALVMLNELKAQPRKEVLEVAKAQMIAAKASLNSSRVQMNKQRKSFELDPQSVSKDTLDNAINAVKVAEASFEVARKQYELTKAGAWIYDIKNQEQQYNALYKSYMAASELLSKYTIKAPIDGVVLSIRTAIGSYISPQGTYGTYTDDTNNPVMVMGSSQNYLAVRCYIDEILVPKLPPVDQMHAKMQAKMFIRGTNISIPLEFVRVQPDISPKIQLSNHRTERVDVRVLPVIFRFEKTKDINVYPGQLVDVYVGEK
ncbi:MAG: HlyD family secretion protein [Methylobacter sp.]